MKNASLSLMTLCLCLFLLFGVKAQDQEKKSEADKPGAVETKSGNEKDKQGAGKPSESVEIKPGKEKGKQERFFAHPLATVKEAMIDAMKAVEFEVKKDKDNQLEAKRKRHIGVFMGSGGETLVIQLQEAEESGVKGTRVTAETKKGFVGRAGQKSWSVAVLDEADRILKKGQQ